MASFLLASTAALVLVFLLISSSFSWTYVHGQGGEEGEDRLIDTLAVEPSEALGRVWSLSHAQTHDRLVASASGRGGVMIFAKYFVQWCRHCKSLKTPFEEAAARNPNVLFVEVDCEAASNVCSDIGVRGYPTLFLWHGDREDGPIPFEGHRTVDGISEFLQRASETEISQLSPKLFDNALNELKVVFVRLRGESDANVDEQHGALFQQAARRGKFSMFFSEVDSSASVSEGMNSLRARCPSSDVSSLSPGAIVAVRPEHCVVLASGWDKARLDEFVSSYSLPLVPALSEKTFSQLKNRLMICVIHSFSPGSESLNSLQKSLASAALERESTTFTTLDFQQFGQFVSNTLGLASDALPALVAIDFSNQVHFAEPNESSKGSKEGSSSSPSPARILSFADAVTAGTISSKSFGSQGLWSTLLSVLKHVGDNPMLIVGIGVLYIGLLILCLYLCRKKTPAPAKEGEPAKAPSVSGSSSTAPAEVVEGKEKVE